VSADGVIAYVAVGSNLGDRAATIEAALSALAASPGIRLLRRSRLLETEPLGPPGQGRYLNGAVELDTTRSPRELLEALLAIERRLGRERSDAVRNGPRTIDLDLLLYGDAIVQESGLIVPHPRLHERIFVLEPLAELAGAVIHPRLGIGIESLLVQARRPAAG